MHNGPATTVDLLRHGEVATPDLFCAPTDEPLSPTGREQLQQTTRQGQWDAIISSPSLRCHDFAEQLARNNKAQFETEACFTEMDFGDWTGKTRKAIWQQDGELMQQLWFQPDEFTAPNGETMQDFIRRVSHGWEALLARFAGKHILLLTHAGVIRVVLAQILNMSYRQTLRFEIGYAQITRVRVYPDGEASLLGHGLSCLKC